VDEAGAGAENTLCKFEWENLREMEGGLCMVLQESVACGVCVLVVVVAVGAICALVDKYKICSLQKATSSPLYPHPYSYPYPYQHYV